MNNKKLKDRARRFHRIAESQEKEKTQEKEVKKMRMNEEKFKNFGPANEHSDDRDRDEPRAKGRCHSRETFQTRLKRAHRRARIAELRRRQHPSINNWIMRDPRFPIRSRRVRDQRRQQLWSVETSFRGLLLEKRLLQRRIRRLKRRLHYLTWQMDSIKDPKRDYRFRTSHPQGPYEKDDSRLRIY